MKIMQQEVTFAPITIVLDTAEDAKALWELARFANDPSELSADAAAMARLLSDWFHIKATL